MVGEDDFVVLEPGNISRQNFLGGGSEYFIKAVVIMVATTTQVHQTGRRMTRDSSAQYVTAHVPTLENTDHPVLLAATYLGNLAF